MVEKPYETHVHALSSAFGVTYQPQNSQPGGSHSAFAIDGSTAQHRGLHKRKRTKSAPWMQGRLDQQSAALTQQLNSSHILEVIPQTQTSGEEAVEQEPDIIPQAVNVSLSKEDTIGVFEGGGSEVMYSPTASAYAEDHSPMQSTRSSLLSSPMESPDCSNWSDDDTFFHGESPPTSLPMLLRQHAWHASPSLSPPSPLSPSDSLPADSSDYVLCGRQRLPKTSKKTFVRMKLGELQDHKISLKDVLLYLLDDANDDFEGYRNTFLSSKHLFPILDNLFAIGKGRNLLEDWMYPHAVELVCERIHTEMEDAKPELKMGTADVTPEFIVQWDINGLMDAVGKKTPTWTKILEAATESKTSRQKTKTSKSRNRITGRNIMSAQAHFLRSFASAKVPIGLGLMAWSCGTSRQMIDVLHHACLSMSYSSIASVITALADRSIEKARIAASHPHALAYDNINISSSIFVEQGPNMMYKVQSGTFAVIYELLGACSEDMKLHPIIENFRKSMPLTISDLRPSILALRFYLSQTTVNVTRILMKYVDGFEKQKSHPSLQHLARRPLPTGHKTIFYPLRASTIEEASIDGNLLVHDDVYVVQLKKDPDNLNHTAIPTFNDQLTNARIRGAQNLRRRDATPWERREIFQIAFGAFHLVMNFIWTVLETHRGTLEQIGSLTHLFAVLEKTRLGGEHPDYHTLLAGLTQILDGLILNAWCKEAKLAGHSSLGDFAQSKPTPEKIIQLAQQIISKYATPTPDFEPIDPKTPPKEFESSSTLPKRSVDTIRDNVRLLTRDLLYVVELVDAIATGDFGRIEDILPTIACMFRGSGSNNYSTEILHMIFNIKYVWTAEFTNIMRDNMLVNPSGVPGKAMGIDMNIEHLIRYLKTLFAAKGIYSNWDRLGNIAGGINYLQAIKKQVTKSMKVGYQGSTHTPVNVSILVWRIADKAEELLLQELTENRPANIRAKPIVDTVKVGYKKFETGSLATFNKRIAAMKHGQSSPNEDDEILPCQVIGMVESDDSENLINTDDDVSLLHDC